MRFNTELSLLYKTVQLHQLHILSQIGLTATFFKKNVKPRSGCLCHTEQSTNPSVLAVSVCKLYFSRKKMLEAFCANYQKLEGGKSFCIILHCRKAISWVFNISCWGQQGISCSQDSLNYGELGTEWSISALTLLKNYSILFTQYLPCWPANFIVFFSM